MIHNIMYNQLFFPICFIFIYYIFIIFTTSPLFLLTIGFTPHHSPIIEQEYVSLIIKRHAQRTYSSQ